MELYKRVSYQKVKNQMGEVIRPQPKGQNLIKSMLNKAHVQKSEKQKGYPYVQNFIPKYCSMFSKDECFISASSIFGTAWNKISGLQQ